MTSLNALLEHKETIREMLSRNCTWVAIAYRMTELTGYKLNASNVNKQVGRYFAVARNKKKVIDVRIKEYIEVKVRGYRGYKTVHVFISDKKNKGTCTMPEAGQCKYPMGEYPFKWCADNAIDGKSYCEKHCNICYREAV